MLGFKEFNEYLKTKRKKARELGLLTSEDSSYSCDGTSYDPFRMKRSKNNGQWIRGTGSKVSKKMSAKNTVTKTT